MSVFTANPSASPYGYFGRTRFELDSEGGFYVRESSYAPGSELPLHSHSRSHLCFVLEGAYTEELGGRRCSRTAGTAIFYPRDTEHGERHEDRGRHLIIDFSSELERALAAGEPPKESTQRTISPRHHVLLYQLRRDLEASKGSLPATVGELIATSLHASSFSSAAPSWLALAQEWLERHWHRAPTLRELAEELGLHPSHLARAYKRSRHLSVGDEIRRLQVLGVQSAVAQGEESFADIALACGFYDQSHMNRVFRSQAGVTPGQYRDLVRGCTQQGRIDGHHA